MKYGKTYNTRDFIPYEIPRLVRIVVLQQEIALHRPRQQAQHEIAPRLHALVAAQAPPHLDCVREKCVLGTALLVLAVRGLEQSLGEGMPMVPIEHSRERKQGVTRARARCVANDHVHPVPVHVVIAGKPAGVEIGDDSGGVNKIPVVEMVVVVQGVAEVEALVAGLVRAFTDDAVPDGVIHQRVDLLVGDEAREGGFEAFQALNGEAGVLSEIVDNIDEDREFRQRFAAEVHAVEIGLSVNVLGDLGDGELADKIKGGRVNLRHGTHGGCPWGKGHVNRKFMLDHCPLIGKNGSSNPLSSGLESDR